MRQTNAREDMTPREREEFEQSKNMFELQSAHQLKVAELELQVRKLETRWTQILRLPFALLSVPVRMMFGVAYIAHAIRGTKPDEKFWDYLQKL